MRVPSTAEGRRSLAKSFLSEPEAWAERARLAGEPLATADLYETAGRLYMKTAEILEDYGVDLVKPDVMGQMHAAGLSGAEAARVWRAYHYVLELAAQASDNGAVAAEMRALGIKVRNEEGE